MVVMISEEFVINKLEYIAGTLNCSEKQAAVEAKIHKQETTTEPRTAEQFRSKPNRLALQKEISP